MSAENDFHYWHLVPGQGWIEGGLEEAFRTVEDNPPIDRVMTICCRTYQSSGFSPTYHWRELTWEHEDRKLLVRTVEEFGDAPERFKKWSTSRP